MALLTLSRGDRRLVDLPTSWSNQGRDEQLQRGAAESLSNFLALAVAKSGANFQIWDAHRSLEEQIAMLKRNYRRVSRARSKSSDRTWDGSTWEKRAGHPNTASPGWSNHGSGLAIDVHPGPIQELFKAEGRDWGWSWTEGQENGEDWHFVFDLPNQYASRGWLDHAWVQKIVGAKIDGKIGVGTVKLIRAWQAERGLEADGIVGPGTKAAMLGKTVADAVGDVAEEVAEAVGGYTLERHQTKNLRPGRIDQKRGLTGKLNALTLHHWGADGQDFDNVVDWLVADGNGNNQSSAHEVIKGGRVAVLADMADGTWNSGSAQGNVDNYAFECRPEADEATVRTVAARVANARAEAGWDVPLNLHQDYVATACPGRYVALRDTIDALSRGENVAVARPVEPTTPSRKATFMDLVKAPDFPLLRTADHLCFYGDQEKIESVTGKMPNSLAPGDITGSGKSSGSRGLKSWQKAVGIEADGRFGDGTKAKAKMIQMAHGLKADGAIGPDTWYAGHIYKGK